MKKAAKKKAKISSGEENKPESGSIEASEKRKGKRPAIEESDDNPRHDHNSTSGFDSVFYSRSKRERGSGMSGGQGYTSRGGFGRRG